jgi:membrane-bound metal-dependent hydrolase YbcI (DUF457 family)
MSPAELGCGAVLACGFGVAPDLDCPSSSIARFAGPLSHGVSKLVAKIALGHRQGTHSLLAVLLVAFGVILGVHSSDARWVELGLAFISASMLFRVLLDGRGLVCVALAAATAAALVTIAAEPGYFAAAAIVGYISHIFPGDFWTIEGVPSPLWPLDRKRRMRFPLLGHTDGWREHVIAAALGLLAAWLLATAVFLPAWKTQTAAAATPQPPVITHWLAHATPHLRAVRGRVRGCSTSRRPIPGAARSLARRCSRTSRRRAGQILRWPSSSCP